MTIPDTTDQITEVVDGVFDLTLTNEPARYRSFLFDWEVPTLVDTGPSEATEALLSRLRSIETTPERMILTHAHHDHVGGFDAVVEEYDVETCVPEQSELQTEHRPDERFSHEASVGPFTAVHIPGHCEDNYALVAADEPVAVMGDAVIGSDWRGLPEGYFIPVEGIYSDDLVRAEYYLERLQEYAFDVGLVFHGSSVFDDARTKLDRFLDFPNKGSWDDRL